MVTTDVTVVLPTRNRSALLQRAVASVARQTLTDIEVVVSDDSSHEESRDANQALALRLGPRYRVVPSPSPHERGSGPAAARNRGIRAARGRYVAFLDDDDQWTWDDYLTTAVTALDKTGADVFCADMQGIRGDVVEIATWFLESPSPMCAEQVLIEPPVYRTPRSAFVRAATRRVLHPNVLVIRRALLEQSGGFSEEFWFGEDSELVLRMADAASGLLFCPRVAARYRLPDADSVSTLIARDDQTRQVLAVARKVKASARTSEVRRAARDVEGWTLRELGRQARADGQIGRSFRLALQGVLAYPTFGGLLELVRITFRRSPEAH